MKRKRIIFWLSTIIIFLWAYAGLTFNLIFATISHIAVDGVVGVSFFPLLILVILAFSYIYHHKIQTQGNDRL